MEEMGGVRYYFLCHLNGSHVIQFLKTAISGVEHPTILQEMVCSLLNFALFFTDRFPHQQISSKVMTLLTKES